MRSTTTPLAILWPSLISVLWSTLISRGSARRRSPPLSWHWREASKSMDDWADADPFAAGLRAPQTRRCAGLMRSERYRIWVLVIARCFGWFRYARCAWFASSVRGVRCVREKKPWLNRLTLCWLWQVCFHRCRTR